MVRASRKSLKVSQPRCCGTVRRMINVHRAHVHADLRVVVVNGVLNDVRQTESRRCSARNVKRR